MNTATPELEKVEDAAPLRNVSGVVLVSGEAFFTRRLELPSSTPAAEVAGFVALQLEELAPFPLDQLYHGFVRSTDGGAVFVYTAYRRRFLTDQVAAWPEAQFVFPDFAPALRLTFPASVVVLLRSENALTAMRFEAGQELPSRVASRPLPFDASEEAVERVQVTVRELVDAQTLPDISWRIRDNPEPRAKGLQFVFAAQDGGTDREVFVPGVDCWAMDVREPEFIAQQRRRLGFDLVLWRVVLGAAAAIAVLLGLEIILGATRGYAGWLGRRSERNVPAVTSIKDRDVAATRLEDFGLSGVKPFDMLGAVGRDIMPEAVRFTRVTIKGAAKLEVEGWSPDVATVNQYESALKGATDVQSVEVVRVSPNAGGSVFTIAITFNNGAFSRAGGVAQNQP